MNEPPLNIVLVEPRIPPNTGNIIRLCVATECRLHLVEPLGFRLEDRYLRRAGLDYWEQAQIRTWANFPDLRQSFAGSRFLYFSTRVNRPYTRADFQPGDFLVFGSEPDGLPERLLVDNLDDTYTIPMWGPVRSLNLSTSVGIVAYEALRQIKRF